ncbi:hypothetical protein [Streptomyces sp. NBC_01750]|uniref:hypothetical protein n=1 Tax=Streptomyces sp. NBC_01750 TaxID=2975928 RepID=UPI002DDB8816|nr:hypothetical protein [Streptomyces sp. NBC_01750]WSD32097.1 hypothetical protein OG966_09400 [Streptomyces sp. NBC_01750]
MRAEPGAGGFVPSARWQHGSCALGPRPGPAPVRAGRNPALDAALGAVVAGNGRAGLAVRAVGLVAAAAYGDVVSRLERSPM